MLNCPHCQQPVASSVKFCGTCGSPVAPQAAQRRRFPWRLVIISLSVLLVLGSAGFLYFLQVTHEIVLWVPKMTPADQNTVALANRFLDKVNAGEFAEACEYNENSKDWCLKNEAPRWKALTTGGVKLTAFYARPAHDSRGYQVYTVVVRGSSGKVYWFDIAPDSPKPPVISGPYETSRLYYRQLLKRFPQ